MTSQINAESTSSAGVAAAGATDAWDRLAALAFDQTTAHEGCSAQAHECACRAEHAAEVPAPAVRGDAAERPSGERAGDTPDV